MLKSLALSLLERCFTIFGRFDLEQICVCFNPLAAGPCNRGTVQTGESVTPGVDLRVVAPLVFYFPPLRSLLVFCLHVRPLPNELCSNFLLENNNKCNTSPVLLPSMTTMGCVSAKGSVLFLVGYGTVCFINARKHLHGCELDLKQVNLGY